MAREQKDVALTDVVGARTATVKLIGDLTTAGLRAAQAWAVRREQPEAWREISRMHGVFLSLLSPGCGRRRRAT